MLTHVFHARRACRISRTAAQKNSTAMGKAFDASKNDDSFYLPPETFNNAEFKRGMKNFISPDGHAVRFIISHARRSDDARGHFAHRRRSSTRPRKRSKGTPLEGSKIYLGGTAATFKDMRDGSNYDLLIAGIASLCLIFIIMLIITRSVVASAVIVGTVLLSLGASFGLSVLIWQHLIGIELHWMVLAMSVIILLAVGADYNLLLVARFKEEIHAGLNTGIIRSMGGTGSVVTSAGLVFAFTMMTMAVSRADGDRPGRHHHRARPALRHPDRPVADDAVHRRAAGQVVLVAAGCPATAEAVAMACAAGEEGRVARQRLIAAWA